MIIYKRKKMNKRVIIIFLLFSLLLLCAGAVPLTPYRQIGDSWFRVVYPEGYSPVVVRGVHHDEQVAFAATGEDDKLVVPDFGFR